MEDDGSDTQRVLKTLENHAMRIKHERDIKVAKVPVTEAVYNANKARSCDETRQLQVDIDDLKVDIKYCETDTNEIIALLKEARQTLAQSLEIRAKPRAEWTRDEAKFVDANIPSEVKQEIADLDKQKIEKYTHKSTLLKIIKEREAKKKELQAGPAGKDVYIRELNSITGQYDHFRLDAGSNLPQPAEASLMDLGREFRAWITDVKTQRTFNKDELLKLLSRYGNAMTPDINEKATIELLKNKIIRNPELPRKTMLESCIPLMQAQARSDFETALHANTSIPSYKKMLLNPADGSLDQKQHHHKGGQRGKGRRQSYNEEGQNKKAKYQDQGKGQNEHGQKSGDRGGHRGGGRGNYRGGGKGRGGYKGQQNFAKGGQKEGQKAAFKDKGGVE